MTRSVAIPVVVAFCLVAPDPLAGQATPPCEDVPAFQMLDFWVGEWTVHAGDQQVGTNRIVKVLDGCAVEEHWTGGSGGRGRSLFYFVPGLQEWRQVWVTDRATAPGAVKEKRLVESFEGAGVRFQGEIPLPEGGSYLDRTTLTPLPEGRVRQLIEISPDGGESWRTTFDAEYRPRTGARGPGPSPASGILERMNGYTGHWISDEKEGPGGAPFHFEYEMEWMDEGHTIARLVITQVRPDGRTVIFEGYKGREPSGDGVYYVGASPSGRGARGSVVLEGDDFVTAYEGWTADGSPVEIRDVFEPVEGGGFVSRTFLRPSPDDEWRQIAEDRWTRVGGSSPEGRGAP